MSPKPIPKNNSSMEKLLLKETDKTFKLPRIGDILEGTIIEIKNNAIYLDLGALGTGVILGGELHKSTKDLKELKVGDKLSASVVEPENEEGYVELSLRQASYEKAWADLAEKKRKGETITTRILEANRGGLIVEINGIRGFLPVSQLSSKHYPRVEKGNKDKILGELKKFIGQHFEVKIMDLNKEKERLIISEKMATKKSLEKALSQYQKGDIIEGKVNGIADFGVFVRFGDDLEGLIHISELDWGLVKNTRDVVKMGEKIKAKVIGINRDKVSLSLKSLKSKPG